MHLYSGGKVKDGKHFLLDCEEFELNRCEVVQKDGGGGVKAAEK